MRLSITLTIFALIISLCTCRNSPEQSPMNSKPAQTQTQNASAISEPLRSLDGNLTVVKNTMELPNSCRSAFVVLSKQSQFEMAEPGQRFQVADVVVEPGLPWRRLVFGAFNRDRCLIHYERGGRGHAFYAVLFTLSADGHGAFFWGGAGNRTESSLQQLRSDIVSGDFKTVDFANGW